MSASPILSNVQLSQQMSFTPQPLDADPSRGFTDLMMADLVCSVMNERPFDTVLGNQSIGHLPDILDFAFDDTFHFSSAEIFTPLVSIDGPPVHAHSGTATPSIQRLASLGQQAFKDSMWLWTPTHGDSSAAEQENLSIPTPELLLADTTSVIHHLSLPSRDRVLALILRTCEQSAQMQIVSCFPSAEMLSKLSSNFISYHSRQFAPWIHVATLDLNQEREVFLLALIASGATNSSFPNVRKLGYAMHEALRLSIPASFEKDNRSTRDLRSLQAMALELQIGLWSGNRRKLEIAESFAYPIITMTRRGGRFRQRSLVDLTPHMDDNVQTTETKWKKWVEHESFKRLAYHLFLVDAGSSYALMSQPLISYAEVCVDLPCSADLWQATSAQEWKQRYLVNHTHIEDSPNLRHVLEDPSQLTSVQSIIDVQLSLTVIVSILWSRVWQCLQMRTLSNYQYNGSGASSMLTVNTYHQELIHAAKNISLRSSDWHGGLGPYAEMLLELCMLHLHVSLEAVQLLAGKDGEEEARKVVPVLRRWIVSAESRQAIFHAGRVLAAARRYPLGYLRDQSAVAVYHASLALWAYAILSEAPLHGGVTSTERYSTSDHNNIPQVFLDEEDGPEMQRFLVLGLGVPAIRKYEEVWFSPREINNYVPLSDTLMAMKSVANLLSSKNGDAQSRPLMVTNLNRLILALGHAAVELKKKGS
ncbi:hypothetical protein LTR05_004417 [Lithohypha guttulata]|uniref:Xylanolytic transcriptional activator regulatory domain-containing protein n=1 Tax=Lithohypha guttulata TaxID=1690604 RepID=A0AAN7SZA0_9EURO|nr:hypothetical protein LTR05_004417 [Lithohypha guttulata]